MINFTKIPHSVRLLLTNKCNLNCSFCLRDASNDNLQDELSTSEWLNFFDRLKELKVFNISLSGGEIFLRDDFFVLLEKLRKNRMHRISLLTNGTLISKETVDQLTRLKMKFLTISLDGLEETHDKIRGKKSFQKTMKGIRHLINQGIYPNISFTPIKDNYREIGPFIDYMVSLGITSIQINTLSPDGRCQRIYEGLVLEYPNQVKEVLDVIKEKRKKFPNIKIKCQFGFYYYLPTIYQDSREDPQNYKIKHLKSGCGAASTSCAVMPNGDVVPCEGLSNFKGGNIKEQDMYSIWKNSENFKIIRDLSKISMDQTPYCKDCKYIYLCDGGCRATSYIIYKDLLAPSILCPIDHSDKIKCRGNVG